MAADSPNAGSFLPGLDILQDMLAKAGTAVPGLGPWATPTLDPEELSKRIEELRTVQFWLENNARLIATTIQSLEVQRMTLTALKSMNVQMGDLAAAFRVPTPPTPHTPPASPDSAAQAPAPAQPSAPRRRTSAKAGGGATATPGPDASPAPGMADPMQWWNTLTQQFGQIAAQAVKEGATAAAGLAPMAAAATGPSTGAEPPPAAAAKTGTARRPARKKAARR